MRPRRLRQRGTPRRRLLTTALVLVLFLCGIAVGLAVWPFRPLLRHSPPAIAPLTDSVLQNASASQEWLTHRRDYANQRYVPLNQINRATVASLRPVWRYAPNRAFQSRNRNESTPLVVDGVLIWPRVGNCPI